MAGPEDPIFLDASMEDLFAEAVASVERHQNPMPKESDTPALGELEPLDFDVDIAFDENIEVMTDGTNESILSSETPPPYTPEPQDLAREDLSDPFTDDLPNETSVGSGTPQEAEPLVQILQAENLALKTELAKLKANLSGREQDIAALVKQFEEAQILYKLKVSEAKQNRERAKEFQSRNSHIGGELRKAIDRIKKQKAQVEALRHRFRKERDELKRYGAEKPFMALLTVLDNLNRALEHSSADKKTLKEGVQITLSQFRSILGDFGVKSILSIKGEAFDPSLQEAILRVETSEVPHGAIYEILQEGFTYHDRLLRPTRVSVGRSVPPVHPPAPLDSLDEAIAQTLERLPHSELAEPEVKSKENKDPQPSELHTETSAIEPQDRPTSQDTD